MSYKYNPLLKHGLQEMSDAAGGMVYPVGYYTEMTAGASDTTTGAVSANIIYGIPIYVESETTVNSLSIKIDAGAVGDAVLGIYKYDTVNNEWDLVAQCSGTINVNTVAVHTLSFASPQVIDSGIYCFALHSSVLMPTIRFINTYGTKKIFGSRITDFADLDLVQYATAYTGTLPATMPMSLISFGAPVIPQILATIG